LTLFKSLGIGFLYIVQIRGSTMNATTLPTNNGVQAGPRQLSLLGALSISLLAALAMAAFSTEQAVGGGWLERTAIPLRMLLLVGGATLLLRTVGETWRDVGLSRPRFGRTTALVVVGYLAMTLVYALISKLLFPALGLTPKTLSLFSAVQGDTAEYLYWLIPVAWGSAAFGEELVFRGYLQTRLAHAFGGRGGVALAVVLQAAVFGALHAYQGLGGAMVAAGAGLVLRARLHRRSEKPVGADPAARAGRHGQHQCGLLRRGRKRGLKYAGTTSSAGTFRSSGCTRPDKRYGRTAGCFGAAGLRAAPEHCSFKPGL
jgi:membrane protease YdiL (CAAX protease family)